MSRNGSGVYSLPATYQATTGQTATAAQHNDPLEDLAADANTARPIVAGGTGATTATAAVAALGIVYVGTVSESGGAPTGAIMQTGSNSNGRYTKFADGTMICSHTFTMTREDVSRLSYDWTFPVAFVLDGSIGPAITPNLRNEQGTTPDADELGALVARQGASVSLTTVKIRQYRVAGKTDFGASDTLIGQATAVGRWY